MAKTAVLTRTHEGAKADTQISPKDQLLRIASSTLLFEDTHYEKGEGIAKNLADLVAKCTTEEVAEVARIAKNDLKLRHVPLWLAVQLAIKTKGQPGARKVVGDLIRDMIKRPDELAEIIALYFKAVGRDESKKGKTNLPASMKRGIAAAFPKFNEYSLAKWNRDNSVTLRDALFLSHPKPQNSVQDLLWKRLMKDSKTNSPALDTPDTWETELSAGKDKKETWERLLRENKLGDIAVLMNLRNMQEAKVDPALIKERLRNWNPKSVALPFRFLSAAVAAPGLEEDLGVAMQAALKNSPKLAGRTLFVVDVSGSMRMAMGGKSKLDRVDVASGLAMQVREVSEEAVVYATGGSDGAGKHATALVPARRSFALRDAIKLAMGNLGGGGIFAYQALSYIKGQESQAFDRVIVFTDEQDCDRDPKQTLAKSPSLSQRNYLINVAAYAPGLETDGVWKRINGWSERVIDWIAFEETGKIAGDTEEDI
jgi:hypothetical protein